MDLYQSLLDLDDFSQINCNVSLLSESVHNNSLFKNENEQNIDRYLREINLKFNSRKREEAFHLLLLFLPQSTNVLLKREGEKWLRMSFNCLNSDNDKLKSAACYVLLYILRTAESIPNLKSEIGKAIKDHHSAESLKKLMSADLEWRKPSYDFLYYYLKLFPAAALAQTSQLEKTMLNFLTLPLSSKEQESIFQAGKIYSCLKGAEIKKLISFGHCSLDVLLESVVETEEYSIDRKHTLPLETLDNAIMIGDPLRKIFTAASLICNTMKFIESFLENCPSGKISLCPRDLLNLPLRILQVDQRSVRKLKGQENAHLATIFPSLYQRALQFLQNILLSVGESFDLFYGVLFDQLLLLLDSIKPLTKNEKRKKNDKNVLLQSDNIRTQIYKTLLTLVQVCGGLYDMPLGIAQSIVDDITPCKEGISLRSIRGGAISKVTVHRKSKKRIFAANAKDDVADEEILAVRTSNGPNVKAALDLATKWIELGHHSIPLRSFELLSTCLTSMAPLLPVGAYCIPEVRDSYYKALIVLALYPHPSCIPSYSTLTHAFSIGTTELDEKVVSSCQRGLSILSFTLSNPQVSIFQDHIAQIRAQKEPEEEKEEKDECEILVTSDEESEDEIEEIPNEQTMNGEEDNVEENEMDTTNEDEREIPCDFPNTVIDLSEDENQEEIYLSSDEDVGDDPVEIETEATEIEAIVECENVTEKGEENEVENNKRKIDTEEQGVKKKKKKSKAVASRRSPRKQKNDKESENIDDLENLLPDVSSMVKDANLEDMLSTFVDAGPDSDSDR